MDDLRAFLADVRTTVSVPEVGRAVPLYALASLVLFILSFVYNTPLQVLTTVVVVVVVYAPAEYLLHKYVLHSLEYLSPRIMARMWIRAHYAHHRAPAQQDVILASPPMFMLLLLILNAPVFLIDPSLCLPWSAAIVGAFSMYEIVHYSAHTGGQMTSRYFRKRRKLHLLHHYHDDRANFGIVTSVIDQMVGSLRESRADTRSPTTFNLGYFGELMRRKPLVREEYEKKYPDVRSPLEETSESDAIDR
jgi:sterol desaturase/sphingolipid hydroxylase (fatty acid hydroxylase superfamily)